MRPVRAAFLAASAVLALAGCGGTTGAAPDSSPPTLEERDPAGFAACDAYLNPIPQDVRGQLDGDLEVILYASAHAHEYAVDAKTEAIAGSVNAELTAQGVPSVVAADLIAACENNGVEVQAGSAAELAQSSSS